MPELMTRLSPLLRLRTHAAAAAAETGTQLPPRPAEELESVAGPILTAKPIVG